MEDKASHYGTIWLRLKHLWRSAKEEAGLSVDTTARLTMGTAMMQASYIPR